MSSLIVSCYDYSLNYHYLLYTTVLILTNRRSSLVTMTTPAFAVDSHPASIALDLPEVERVKSETDPQSAPGVLD